MRFRMLAVIAVAFLSLPPVGPVQGEPSPENVCEITGTVAGLNSLQRSPWADGTPSMIENVTETSISITVSERRPHYKGDAESLCKVAPGETRTYKLCSPARVNKGDRIQATEGLHTGSTLRCLFDLVVLRQPPAL